PLLPYTTLFRSCRDTRRRSSERAEDLALRKARSPSPSEDAGMRKSGRGIDARTLRCYPPSPDRLLGPPSREAIRGVPYKGQELRGRRSRQSNSFQTRAVWVYSS